MFALFIFSCPIQSVPRILFKTRHYCINPLPIKLCNMISMFSPILIRKTWIFVPKICLFVSLQSTFNVIRDTFPGLPTTVHNWLQATIVAGFTLTPFPLLNPPKIPSHYTLSQAPSHRGPVRDLWCGQDDLRTTQSIRKDRETGRINWPARLALCQWCRWNRKGAYGHYADLIPDTNI